MDLKSDIDSVIREYHDQILDWKYFSTILESGWDDQEILSDQLSV